MGTLTEPDVRSARVVTREEIEGYLGMAMELAKKNNVELRDVLAAASIVEARRRNSLYADSGNYLDEKLADFGVTLRDMAEALDELVRRTTE